MRVIRITGTSAAATAILAISFALGCASPADPGTRPGLTLVSVDGKPLPVSVVFYNFDGTTRKYVERQVVSGTARRLKGTSIGPYGPVDHTGACDWDLAFKDAIGPISTNLSLLCSPSPDDVVLELSLYYTDYSTQLNYLADQAHTFVYR